MSAVMTAADEEALVKVYLTGVNIWRAGNITVSLSSPCESKFLYKLRVCKDHL
jgi:hypothetical protein